MLVKKIFGLFFICFTVWCILGKTPCSPSRTQLSYIIRLPHLLGRCPFMHSTRVRKGWERIRKGWENGGLENFIGRVYGSCLKMATSLLFMFPWPTNSWPNCKGGREICQPLYGTDYMPVWTYRKTMTKWGTKWGTDITLCSKLHSQLTTESAFLLENNSLWASSSEQRAWEHSGLFRGRPADPQKMERVSPSRAEGTLIWCPG